MDDVNVKPATERSRMPVDPKNVELTCINKATGLPFLHETFVLHTFVPIRYVRRQKAFDDPNFVGMYPEGFRIPTMLTNDGQGNVVKKTSFDDEVVCMMVGKETVGPDDEKSKDCDCIANTAATRPGFLNLNPRGPVRQAKSAPAYTREKSRSMLMSEVNSRGTSSRMYLKNQNKIQEESDIVEESESLTPRTFSANASAKSKRKKLPDNVEYALALRHPSWPEIASEWSTRTRNVGWPGKRLEKKIVSGGCHVSPGAHPLSGDPEIEWTFNFYEAERILNKEAVSSAQRQCFIMFCMILLDCVESEMLSLQQLKSVFFFVCETTDPKYWRINKALCVDIMLEHLQDCVRSANLPDYFVIKNNTLSSLAKETLVKLEAEVSRLRNNSVTQLLSLTKSCAFVNIFPFYCNVSQLFAPFLEDAKGFAKQKEVEKSVRALLTITDELCNSFYLDTGFEAYEESFEEIAYYINSIIAHGVSGFEEAIEYFVKPLQGDKEAQKHLQFLPQLLSQKNITLSEKLPPTEIWRPIRMCRMLIQKFADGKTGSHLYDHLACMYHAASTVFTEQKKEVILKAEQAFKDALSKEDCGIGTFVDYGNFLAGIKKYQESVPVLRKVVMKEAKKPESINFYGKMEALVVDDFVKREIEATDGLEVFSCSFAYYGLCESLIQLKKKDELLKTLKQFGEYCTQMNDAKSCALLGYSYMKIRQFQKAMGMFKKVLELAPGDKMAQDSIGICDKNMKHDTADADVALDGKMERLKLL